LTLALTAWPSFSCSSATVFQTSPWSLVERMAVRSFLLEIVLLDIEKKRVFSPFRGLQRRCSTQNAGTGIFRNGRER